MRFVIMLTVVSLLGVGCQTGKVNSVQETCDKRISAKTPSDPVLKRLANVESFAFGPIGRGGVISSGEKDYRKVLSRQNALQDYEYLYSLGNQQAQCYALVGIRSLNPTRFSELSQTLDSKKTDVVVRNGCSQMRIVLHLIVKWIDEGRYSQTSEKEKTESNK
jgi:hypothetical protein